MKHRNGFSLIELLSVIAIMSVLCGLGALSLKGSGAAQLSAAGSQISGFVEAAREFAIVKRQPVAVVMLASGKNTANRVFTMLQYVAPDTSGGLAQWKQISRWEMLPQGVLMDSGEDSAGNALKALSPANSPVANAALPTLTFANASFAPRAAAGYGYVIFMPDGSLYQDSTGSLPTPCVLRLVEAQQTDNGMQYTSRTNASGRSANFFEISLNQATGRAKIIRPSL